MRQPDNPLMGGSNVQRAATFFRQPAWARLLNALYEKYIAQGRASGQVVLRACSAEEKREIARFLQKRLPPGETLVVRLADFQEALNTSGFPCELAELLAALYPERSHVTRPEQRKRRVQDQQYFYEALSSLADALPAEARGRRWLLAGTHGRDYLFRHHKNDGPAFQEAVLHSARTVIDALNQLPTPSAYERLSLFAQRVSGDPHSLDAQSFTGRLFLYALQDLADLNRPQHNEEIEDEQAANGVDEEGSPATRTAGFLIEDTSSSREQNQQRLLLYYEAGLLTDTISSTVATFQLARAEDAAGVPDPLVEHAGTRVLVLPLRQLLSWQRLAPASQHVYLFENPQVFETIIDELQQATGPAGDERQQAWPTLICTSGWPGVAVIRLLNLLTETDPHTLLHYSGDFDLAGLRIASYLQKRYRAHFRPWHLDPPSYLVALHHKSAAFETHELASLQSLPADFAPLAATMQEQGKKAYQEGITHLLFEDIMAAGGC